MSRTAARPPRARALAGAALALAALAACAPSRTVAAAAPRSPSPEAAASSERAAREVREPEPAAASAPTAAPEPFREPAPPAAPLGPVATLPGCPPPPRAARPPRTSFPPRWRPPRLVPERALPEPLPPAPRGASLRALHGRGLWVWRARLCEDGTPEAIVARARSAGLRQLWVRVGDSRDGFYAAALLTTLLPLAHRAGIAVLGWGFPYLYDPVSDAAWGREALAFRSPEGDTLDGFSPDLESASEGTRMSPLRARVYLSLLRPAAAASGRPLVATVFRPTPYWLRRYPYEALAPYVDAFVPMVYWGCHEPGEAAVASVRALARWAPVHVLGQSYDMVEEGGRAGAPSADEIARFCDASRRAGALGASLWHWQTMTPEQWSALSQSAWPDAETLQFNQ